MRETSCTVLGWIAAVACLWLGACGGAAADAARRAEIQQRIASCRADLAKVASTLAAAQPAAASATGANAAAAEAESTGDWKPATFADLAEPMVRNVTYRLDEAEAALAAGDLDTAGEKVGEAVTGLLVLRF